ncbi:murein hydrolase transporter LrgA [Cohnella kolymensis]|uniref:Murein hydrolase transporter LrgA n=1 Tax=Cohnella kolymensis TaxID=1590652 RepID=A0ABR5A3A6_9BACL|nr:CidA/LrgA family protein [Cohnella kolymensis]KIL35520.1 murein hydrolase transporter LrgA [Cohnella kolymensis]
MQGLAILLGFQFLGYIARQFLHIPLPANVIGLILLVVSLFCGWIKLEWIERSAQFLLKHMMVFFAPTIVGTIVFFPTIAAEWVSISLSLAGGTLAVLLITGWSTAWLAERERSQCRE